MPTEAVAKSLKSKTVWFGLAIGVLSVLQSSLSQVGLTPEQLSVVGPIVGTLIIALRAVTTQPLSDK